MNAGFSNLAVLKAQLLGGVLKDNADWDETILAIGLGVAGAFSRQCGRKWDRVVGDTWEVGGISCTFVLPRYPVESLTSAEVRNFGQPWEVQDLTGAIQQFDSAAGVIVLSAPLGGAFTQVRWTWTGGFWWEQLEPTDAGYPTSQPVGSAAIPADILHAWFLQCAEVWNKIDRTGAGISMPPDQRAKLSTLELIPAVRDILRTYVRYA